MTDASEADLQEQQFPVRPNGEPVPLTVPPEVPEADAVEQAQPAPLDDEEHR
ncbi:MAG: hypothetical protein ABR540_11800 [Acidimicrobiales bacterium]|nr:hypothetical protein [Actinomycetota bacterium]